MTIENSAYWQKFYKENSVASSPSGFAKYVTNYILKHNLFVPLLDIGCGNGRDSCYFASQGIDVTGIDFNSEPDDQGFKFYKADLKNFDYSNFSLLYLRFVVHTLTESELDNLISLISGKAGTLVFIETRSTLGVTDELKSETYFKSSVGEKHFRMLYSKKYLDEKLSQFKILESAEGKYSKYGSDDPVCIRYILQVV